MLGTKIGRVLVSNWTPCTIFGVLSMPPSRSMDVCSHAANGLASSTLSSTLAPKVSPSTCYVSFHPVDGRNNPSTDLREIFIACGPLSFSCTDCIRRENVHGAYQEAFDRFLPPIGGTEEQS